MNDTVTTQDVDISFRITLYILSEVYYQHIRAQTQS